MVKVGFVELISYDVIPRCNILRIIYKILILRCVVLARFLTPLFSNILPCQITCLRHLYNGQYLLGE